MAENKQVEVKEVELQLIAKEFTNKEKGNKFIAYTTYLGKNQKLVTLKFRKDVTNLPKENGVLVVINDQVNLDKTTKYPTLWVKSFVKFTKSSEVKAKAIDFDNLPF